VVVDSDRSNLKVGGNIVVVVVVIVVIVVVDGAAKVDFILSRVKVS
jgi:hypothetical protein